MHSTLTFPLLLGAALILAGCEEDDSWDTQDAIPIVVSDSLYDAALTTPQAELTIEHGEIRGDYLKLTVSYLGGCGDHDFGLAASMGINKSNPPGGFLILTHDSGNDTCTYKISQYLLFDLSPYREYLQGGLVKSGPITLSIRPTRIAVYYEF